jgi:hypothetical protein
MSLFELENVDFLSKRITSQEVEQVTEWARAELESRIALGGSEPAQHLMQMVAHRVTGSLQEVLLTRHHSDKQNLHSQAPFVRYYVQFLQTHLQSDNKQEEPSTNQLATEQERLEQKEQEQRLREKIEQRDEQRGKFLCEALHVEAPASIRFSKIADWFVQQHAEVQTSAQFNLTVEVFIEHLTQRMLEKVLQHVIFPTVK